MLRVLKESGLGIQEWLERTSSLVGKQKETINYEDLPGKIDGDL